MVLAEVYWATTRSAETLANPAIEADRPPVSSNAVSLSVESKPNDAFLTWKKFSASAEPNSASMSVPTNTTLEPSRLTPTVPLTASDPSTSRTPVPLARMIRPAEPSAESVTPVAPVATVSIVFSAA